MKFLQRENLRWRVAWLPNVPQLQLTDRVHSQNLCCPQVGHSIHSATVCILWTTPTTQSSNAVICNILDEQGLQRKYKPVFMWLTYDPRNSFMVGSEDDDPAILADCDDLRAAAHQTSAGGVVAREVMCSSPALGNRNCLQSKCTRCWKRTSIG